MQGIKNPIDLHNQNTYLRQNQSAWDFFQYLVDWKSNNLVDKKVNVHTFPLGINEIFQIGIIFIGNSYDMKMGTEHLIFTQVGITQCSDRGHLELQQIHVADSSGLGRMTKYLVQVGSKIT